jgi:hypothetical protein
VWNDGQIASVSNIEVAPSKEVTGLSHYHNKVGSLGLHYVLPFAFFLDTTFELDMNHIQTKGHQYRNSLKM